MLLVSIISGVMFLRACSSSSSTRFFVLFLYWCVVSSGALEAWYTARVIVVVAAFRRVSFCIHWLLRCRAA